MPQVKNCRSVEGRSPAFVQHIFLIEIKLITIFHQDQKNPIMRMVNSQDMLDKFYKAACLEAVKTAIGHKSSS